MGGIAIGVQGIRQRPAFTKALHESSAMTMSIKETDDKKYVRKEKGL